MTTKKAFLVELQLKQGYCISRAFEAIANAIHGHVKREKSYVYNEVQFNKTYGMLITLITNGNHEEELMKILESARKKSEEGINYFWIFAFDDLLNNDEAQVKKYPKERS